MKRNPKVLLQSLIDEAVVPFFGEEKIELNGRYGPNGETPLHVFATRGDYEACEILISAGAEQNIPAEHGFTALHEAITQGHYAVTELLLSNGADPKMETELGKTESLASEHSDIHKLIEPQKSEPGGAGNA